MVGARAKRVEVDALLAAPVVEPARVAPPKPPERWRDVADCEVGRLVVAFGRGVVLREKLLNAGAL